MRPTFAAACAHIETFLTATSAAVASPSLCRFLCRVGASRMGQLFRAEIDSTLLAEVIAALASASAEAPEALEAPFATAGGDCSGGGGAPPSSAASFSAAAAAPPDVQSARILVALSRGTRFDLCLGFLGAADRAGAVAIAGRIAARLAEAEAAAADELRELHTALLHAYGSAL